MSQPQSRLAALLFQHDLKVVFAESCTAGLASATLAAEAGISSRHCGGMIVYRNETKQQYLGISAALLEEFDAVSERIAREMAERVLERTPEADFAASVTGHLGPNAPEGKDGLVFIGIARRGDSAGAIAAAFHCSPDENRVARQKSVAAEVLKRLADEIERIVGR